jgi:hypothetical protein
MYSYSIFHIFSIRFHIRIQPRCGLSDTIRIHIEQSSDKVIKNLIWYLTNNYKIMLIQYCYLKMMYII